MAARLQAVRLAFGKVVDHVMAEVKRHPNEVFAGSVPYLMLAGQLAAGWQFGRGMLAAIRKLAEGEDVGFVQHKIAVARFYADHVLMRLPGLRGVSEADIEITISS